MLTHDVVVWSIRNRKGRAKPCQLRWKVGTEPKSKAFLTKALADSFRADLLNAAKKGELFDTETGLPAFMLAPEVEEPPMSWYDFAAKYTAMRWPGAAAKTRESIVDSLTVATLAMLDGEALDLPRKEIRAAMQWALIPREESKATPVELVSTVRILQKSTLPLADMASPIVARRVSEALDLTLDQRAAAADTTARRRRGLNTALEYGIDLDELKENPLKRIKQKKIAKDDAVDRRAVVNPEQARELLAAVSYVGSWHRARGRRLVAFYATLYFAGVRPAEAVGLRHAALSTWLNAGVDATEVAARAGNSVEVLLKRYAKCLDGRQDQNNRRIDAVLTP